MHPAGCVFDLQPRRPAKAMVDRSRAASEPAIVRSGAFACKPHSQHALDDGPDSETIACSRRDDDMIEAVEESAVRNRIGRPADPYSQLLARAPQPVHIGERVSGSASTPWNRGARPAKRKPPPSSVSRSNSVTAFPEAASAA